jgi:nucleoside phosphorylase
VVSTGYCGALDPALGVAGVVVGTSVVAPDRVYKTRSVTADAPFHFGGICSLGHVVQGANEKKKLYLDGACAVEMEAAGVAKRAETNSLPFYCIKAVTDLADETMAIDFNAALRPDGHFGTISILGSVLRHPSARMPELLRLRARCVRASHALGDFLAACRF